MIKIGITGIIGSGKSLLSHIFKIFSIPVYDADINAKKIMLSNNFIKENLLNYFGQQVYIDGMINKKFLSEQIFNSEIKRKYVNSIVHPIVTEDFLMWSNMQNSEITAIESAILYEANIDMFIDFVIEIETPVDILIKRLKLRNNFSAEESLKRIEIQSLERKDKNPDFIIKNNEVESVLEQTIVVLEKIKEEICRK